MQERTAALEAEIAERARMESVLRERDAALHRAHVMTKLAHVITRPDGSFETWSETLPPLIGVVPARMPQSTREWMGLLHPQDRSTFRDMSIAAGATGTRKDVEYRLRRADGAWIHVRQVIEPIPGKPMPTARCAGSARCRTSPSRSTPRSTCRRSSSACTLLDQITRAIGERQDLQSIYQVAIRSLEEHCRSTSAASASTTRWTTR